MKNSKFKIIGLLTLASLLALAATAGDYLTLEPGAYPHPDNLTFKEPAHGSVWEDYQRGIAAIELGVGGQVAAPTFTPDSPSPSDLFTNNPFAPLKAFANILPSWDPTATNTFGAGELIIGAAPLWKAQTAQGTTPYLSTFADYFPWRNLGFEGELVTLGDGSGNSSVDSAAFLLKPRKDIGNIAGFLLLGPSVDLHRGKIGGDAGLGLVYRYHTSIEFFADTRYRVEGRQAVDNGFLARIGTTFAFSKYH